MISAPIIYRVKSSNRTVRFSIYLNVREMNRAASETDKRTKHNGLAYCCRARDGVVDILLAETQLNVGILAHEVFHAVVYLFGERSDKLDFLDIRKEEAMASELQRIVQRFWTWWEKRKGN